MTSFEQDSLYATPRDEIQRFVFDEQVAAVFPDMISRSVPGYASIVAMAGILAGKYVQPGSRIYDLGCSLGAAIAAINLSLDARDCRLIAVDNAPAMLDKAREQLADTQLSIEFLCADVRQVEIFDASLVVLNFTLQFLPLEDRLGLLRRIRAGLRPGGVLLLSEKIAGRDGREDRLLTELHHAFKRANGYSELEISQKRSALEHVLVPEPLDAHLERLRQAGFSRADRWFQHCNFVSVVARP